MAILNLDNLYDIDTDDILQVGNYSFKIDTSLKSVLKFQEFSKKVNADSLDITQIQSSEEFLNIFFKTPEEASAFQDFVFNLKNQQASLVMTNLWEFWYSQTIKPTIEQDEQKEEQIQKKQIEQATQKQ